MSELNEEVQVTVDDAPVATVPLVENFTADNAAPKASFVGSALDEKADIATIMNYVTITVDGQESDNQGVILLYGDDIPIDDTSDAPTVKAAIAAVDGKGASDIPYAIGVSIKDKIDEVAGAVSAVDAKTANTIIYADTTTIKSKVDGIETTLGTVQTTVANAVLVTAQTLTDAEKLQVRTNIGAASAAEYVSVNSQSFTTTQQAQARTNIGAISADDAVSVNAQTLTTTQQTQARTNIAAADADTVSGLSTLVDDMFKTVNYTYTLTSVAAGASATIAASDFGITAIDGYTPVAITAVSTGTNVLVLYYISLTTNGNVMMVKNVGNAAATDKEAFITILWAKSSLL